MNFHFFLNFLNSGFVFILFYRGPSAAARQLRVNQLLVIYDISLTTGLPW